MMSGGPILLSPMLVLYLLESFALLSPLPSCFFYDYVSLAVQLDGRFRHVAVFLSIFRYRLRNLLTLLGPVTSF